LVPAKAGGKHELLFNEPASALLSSSLISTDLLITVRLRYDEDRIKLVDFEEQKKNYSKQSTNLA
jgi:hypothetical protein